MVFQKMSHRTHHNCIGLFQNYLLLFAVPPKFCISIVFNFSWDLQSPQEKLETMLMQNFGGTKKSIMVFLKKAYSPFQKLQGDWVQALGVVV